jgi:ubiquinone biosynthesis monooxygenase Coq7
LRMISTAIIGFDRALRTLTGLARSSRPIPGHDLPVPEMSEDERRLSAGLMRVNHTGEVCAQALYSAQAAVARDPTIAARFASAAREEEDHLAWTQSRLAELGDRTSLLNPLWYAGSFAIGALAGLVGDRVNLGFVVETERQVEEHLTTHLDRLPDQDAKSRAIVDAMRADEARHGAMAYEAGAAGLPPPVPTIMRAAANVMKAVAYRL